jgi:hypothetical protein
MNENENLVSVQDTENVEQTTEETVPAKVFTQDELNAAVGKAKARERAKLEKQYKKEYGDLIDVLEAGTGKKGVGEITNTFTEFYKGKGVTIPEKPRYTDKEIDVLAQHDAADIISAGYEDVVEEVDRLTELGVENMSAREKAYFKVLAEHRQNTERQNELAKIGVTDDVYNSREFQDFAGKFNPKTPISEIYAIYSKTQPKKEIKPMGSMKQSQAAEVKDYYSPEEIAKLSMAELKDPKIWEAVRRSMTGG